MTERNNPYAMLDLLDRMKNQTNEPGELDIIASMRKSILKTYAETNMEYHLDNYRYFIRRWDELLEKEPDNAVEIERCKRKIRALLKTLLDNDIMGSYKEDPTFRMLSAQE